MFGSEKYADKWKDILDHGDLPEIKDYYRRAVTTVILENQEQANKRYNDEMSGRSFLSEAASETANVQNWDPVLISLVRRAMPNLIAYDLVGVQPMSGPTGLVFAMRSKYTSRTGDEAFYNEADTDFTGTGLHSAQTGAHAGPSGGVSFLTASAALATNAASPLTYDAITGEAPVVGASIYKGSDLVGVIASIAANTNITLAANAAVAVEDNDELVVVNTQYGEGMTTQSGERLGTDSNPAFPEMTFTIDKTSVTAKTRALKSEYTMEMSQDLKAIHGLDAEAELGNILSTEILAEINREVIRTINTKAKAGCQQNYCTTKGSFDLINDSDGRWHNERYKGLVVQLSLEANQIAKETRRGKGNFILCSSDVASVLAASGRMTYTPDMSTDLTVDDTGSTFAGMLDGMLKVYIDPYSTNNYATIGYRGSSPYDAGLFYCPYVPLVMVRAVGEEDFQPRIGFKTRYGMVTNPFSQGTTTLAENAGTGANRSNVYYRGFNVANLLDASQATTTTV